MSETPGEDAFVATAALLAELKGLPAPPDPDERLFEDVGCTSFDMMVVCVRLEELAGHTVDLTALSQALTVRDLASLI